MNEILKAAALEKQAVGADELSLINRQALRTLSEDEVFTFRLAACDDQVDREYERFTLETLQGFAEKFVGRTVLMDHQWSAGAQTARVYAAVVEESGGVHRLILRCYMPRCDKTLDTIVAIESGILRECSVGLMVERVICGICGANQMETLCQHRPGREYDGKLCVMDLDGAKDAYEVSLVAVPAQPGAGIIKSKRYGGAGEPQEEALMLAMAIQAQEEQRYGGVQK